MLSGPFKQTGVAGGIKLRSFILFPSSNCHAVGDKEKSYKTFARV